MSVSLAAMMLPQGMVSQTVTITSTGGTAFCAGSAAFVAYTVSAPYSNVPSPNVFSVQLSDAAGSFTGSPVTIGVSVSTTSGTIGCTLPGTLTPSALYRFRIVSSNPATTGPNNGANISVQTVPASPSPTVFGNGTWNVYCYNSTNLSNYYGFYTENGSGASGYNFDSQTRWASNTSPSSANASSGLAYSGCPLPNMGSYSMSYKRTNFACGYYRIDYLHDNGGAVFINGVGVFGNPNAGNDPGVWQGFLGPTSQVEIVHANTSGVGYSSVSIYTVQLFFISPSAVSMCSGSSTLSVNFISGFTYSWTPSTGLSTTTGTTTVASPTVSTVYTCAGTDPVTSCPSTTSVNVTISPVNNTTLSPTSSTLNCSAQGATLTASGASSYSWSPAAGLNSTSGPSVIATPSVSTIYTLSGNNNCSVVTRTTLVSVSPLVNPTVFPSGTWNVYCYNSTNWTNYYGYYTENGSGPNGYNFDSQTRWGANTSPSNAGPSSGLAYLGCPIANGAAYSTSHRRTNFNCGYYRIDLNHDNDVRLFINGVQVFTTASVGVDNDVWRGYLGPTSQVEVRHINGGGPGYIGANVYTVTPPSFLNSPGTICAGTSMSLTATFVSGYTYSWSPSTGLSTTTGTVTIASPTVSTVYTCAINDPTASCTSIFATTVAIGLPTTSVSPITVTVGCATQPATLVAGGAATYSWAPASGLNATTGFSVLATPSVSTVYTVSGSNNCTAVTATTSVVAPVNPSVFPSGTWNAYCYNSTNWTNYVGYYTENGSGASGLDFDTNTRWGGLLSPSLAAVSNGNAYVGCAVPPDNFTMSFKRTGFTCNVYSIQLLNNDDDIALYINGALVVQRGTNNTSENIWLGVLTQSTTVEIQFRDISGGARLNVQFNLAMSPSPTLAVWSGTTSTNWFTSSNWCGSAVPSSSVHAVVFNSASVFQPSIGASGAACARLYLSPRVTAGVVGNTTYQSIPGASLSLGSFSLSVFGDWLNYGSFSGPTGTVGLLGTGTRSLICTGTQTFANLVLNGSGTVVVPSGTHVVSNNMSLSNGVMSLTGGALQFLNGATAVNSNTTSYVDGSITKFGNQAFTFPVGGGGSYRPISISAPALSTDNFTARYFRADPSPSYTHTSKDATIDHISRCEYWILDRTGGASSVSVSLSWDPGSCGVSFLPDLRVARWDAGLSRWRDMGNGATTGNTTAGTVISGSLVTSFSPFTLGSASVLNALPVELLSLEATCTQQDVTVRWVTATEEKNSTFTLERSTDGEEFSYVTSVKSSAASGMTREYAVSDKRLTPGVVYYRLMQTDYNQVKRHLMTTVTDCGGMDDNITLFPNPTSQSFRLVGLKGQADVYVTDMFGRTVLQQTVREDSPDISMEGQAAGAYQVRVKTAYSVTLLKVVKN